VERAEADMSEQEVHLAHMIKASAVTRDQGCCTDTDHRTGLDHVGEVHFLLAHVRLRALHL
jgi:hypothetical protein